MTPFWGILIPIILIIYSILLHRFIGKKRDANKLMWAFGVIAIIGFVLHMILFNFITEVGYSDFNDLTSRFLFAVQYSLEMFIGNTIILKTMDTIEDCPVLFYIYIPVYGMAVITSCFAIFHLVSRWLHNRSWLRKHRHEAGLGKAHIFIGCNTQSEKLAEDIRTNHSEQRIIFIDLLDEGDRPQGISILDIIARLFKDSKEIETLDKYVVLKAGKGLERLVEWFQNKENKVYILSDNQDANLAILEKLWEFDKKFECKVFCHAKKEGIVCRYDSITDIENKVIFIDSAYLAIEQIKKDPEGKLLPVNFVDIAQDDNSNRKLGYVTSPFNCAVVGLGETGIEAVKFLYEYGAFPNKEYSKSPFKCHVFDNNTNITVANAGFDLCTVHSTTVTEKEFEIHQSEIKSVEFKNVIARLIKSLNYIVICLGDDSLNLKLAIDIAELAVISGRDTKKNFCVLIKQSQLSKLSKDTLNEANKVFGNCLHTFGVTESIWKEEIVSNEAMDKLAKTFFDSYTNLSRMILEREKWDIPNWEQRLLKMRKGTYNERCEAKRQLQQDYSNCLHITTKRKLCEPYSGLAELIYNANVGDIHCKEDNYRILEHLAVGEHLRWEASHLTLGYHPTDGITVDALKLHNCIRPYDKLGNTKQHFDWLVVKNSL